MEVFTLQQQKFPEKWSEVEDRTYPNKTCEMQSHYTNSVIFKNANYYIINCVNY